jgi:hypothetical protein
VLRWDTGPAPTARGVAPASWRQRLSSGSSQIIRSALSARARQRYAVHAVRRMSLRSLLSLRIYAAWQSQATSTSLDLRADAVADAVLNTSSAHARTRCSGHRQYFQPSDSFAHLESARSALKAVEHALRNIDSRVAPI